MSLKTSSDQGANLLGVSVEGQPRITAPGAGTLIAGDRRSLTGGGADGNEQLTAAVGAALLVLLAVLGVTIIQIGQLVWLHLFLGLLLLGPIAMKMGSTGYRFTRYYTNAPAYRRKGPPQILLRLLAPAVVLSTVTVFATGVLLLADGPGGDLVLLLHKVSFFVWLAATGLHVLGHLPGMPEQLKGFWPGREDGTPSPGSTGRWLALAGPIVAGAVLAIVLIPDFGTWTSFAAHHHHHH